MKDFLGQEIKEGDRVISHYSGGYAGLRWGTVLGFSPKMVKVQFGTEKQSRYSHDLVVMGEEQQKSLLVKVLQS
jgi:hypothetical protein